jgi:hypothetical protein
MIQNPATANNEEIAIATDIITDEDNSQKNWLTIIGFASKVIALRTYQKQFHETKEYSVLRNLKKLEVEVDNISENAVKAIKNLYKK